MRKRFAVIVAIGGTAGALALPASAGAVPDPLLTTCAVADSTPLLYCEPPVDCQVTGENDCFPTNFDIGLEDRRPN